MFKNIAQQLGKTGLCVVANFLCTNTLNKIASDLDGLRATGIFRKAGIGQGLGHGQGAQVREDETHWWDRNVKSAAQKVLWKKLDLLQLTLNRGLYLGLTKFDGHYAAYPAGGFYQRHRDSFQGQSDRVVSFVLYLNRNWQSADGGHLRIYKADSHLDIDPVGGTMVCFMSNESEHEVLLSHRERFSFTGWFKR